MIHWTFNKNLSLFSVTEIMENINDTIDTNADIIFGTTTDDTLAKDEVKITIVATGFETQPEGLDGIDDPSPIKPENPNNIANDPNYYDVPPFMRGYAIKHTIK